MQAIQKPGRDREPDDPETMTFIDPKATFLPLDDCEKDDY